MQLKKYQGDPRTEGLHIQLNRVEQEIRAAKKRKLIASGKADSGIQAMRKSKPTPITGRYWGRLAHHEVSETIQDEKTGKWINVYGSELPQAGQRLPASGEYETEQEASRAAEKRSREHTEPDPKIFGPQLPHKDEPMLDIEKLLQMRSFNNTLETARQGGAEALSQKNLEHPEFQKAFARTNSHYGRAAQAFGGEIPEPFQVAQLAIGGPGGNKSAQDQLNSLEEKAVNPEVIKDIRRQPIPGMWTDEEKANRLGKGSLGQKFKTTTVEPAQPKTYSDDELRRMGLK